MRSSFPAASCQLLAGKILFFGALNKEFTNHNIFFYCIRPFLTRKIFQELFGLEGSKNFLEKSRLVHNLKISDRLLRFFSKKYSWFYMQRIS